ncbi:hypothetical protein JCM21714_4240 [Gracilibacillus boraciitolerans JCM 21714]|uniref:Inosose isomerase n=1 Tax=Gracilibacillus boraciitolerans JCM 21714 TaxID=1298598 RepID=W4VPE9_9BACI|nr:hypothetical protein [Gracilibacillus boraciitolerans]GAE95036.1 hypothetical protein JCM21714_4240 [Gracilibacillus boraciitolerans JCM 21714]
MANFAFREGELPLGEIIQFLQKKNYRGDWLVEIDGYSGDPDEACQISFDFLKDKLVN